MRWGGDDQYAEPATPAAADTDAVYRAGAESTPIAAAGAANPVANRWRLSGDQRPNGLGESNGINRLLEHDVGELLALTDGKKGLRLLSTYRHDEEELDDLADEIAKAFLKEYRRVNGPAKK